MKTYLKFGSLIAVILGTLLWLAMGGISETKTYYKTIAELNQLGDSGKDHRLRVGGDVADSIHREGHEVRFTLTQDKLILPVVYNGMEPLAGYFQAGRAGAGRRKTGRGRRVPRDQDPGEMRFEV